ncbi:MAG: leucine zipper domain-containing protein [Candidatus Bipolaricaulaceae bacterium]
MRLVETHLGTLSMAETAGRWHTLHNVVRTWVQRYRDDGVKGLPEDRSRRPHRFPTQTAPTSRPSWWRPRRRQATGGRGSPAA